MNNWIEINKAALADNFRAIQNAAGPETEVLAVIKANAYGHGIAACATTLAAAGARWLGVTCASEGARVRTLVGEAPDILIMCGFLPDDVPTILASRLIPVLWTPEQIAWLRGTGIRIQLEIDTGMGRQGCTLEDLPTLLDKIRTANLQLDGVFTHYTSSEDPGGTMTRLQQQRFTQAIAIIAQAGLKTNWVHAGNTSAVDNPVQDNPIQDNLIQDNLIHPRWLQALAATVGARPMVRTGLALFGYTLPTPHAALRPALTPVLTWKAHILAVRQLAPGETVGYGATFTADRPMQIALVPVGYADGLRRELSHPAGWMQFHHHKVHILGRISMNLSIIDVTGIDKIAPGDEVTILGPGITADDHAALAHTIAYEILCAIKPCT